MLILAVVKSVNAGYMRNVLYPRGLAIYATNPEQIKAVQLELARRATEKSEALERRAQIRAKMALDNKIQEIDSPAMREDASIAFGSLSQTQEPVKPAQLDLMTVCFPPRMQLASANA